MYILYRNIKSRRKLLGLSQKQLADKVGYADKSMICKIENGEVDLSLSKIIAIAEALETTPQDLMGWSSDTVSPSLQ